MNRIFVFLAVFLVALALILGAVWLLNSQNVFNSTTGDNSSSTQDLTKNNGDTDPGHVSVAATLVTEDNAAELNASDFNLDKNFVFYVEMNTHSVDITSYKMANISYLDVNGLSYQASEWANSTDGGGHHRNGFLVFDKKGADAKQLKLTIEGIAGVAQREFEWSL